MGDDHQGSLLDTRDDSGRDLHPEVGQKQDAADGRYPEADVEQEIGDAQARVRPHEACHLCPDLRVVYVVALIRTAGAQVRSGAGACICRRRQKSCLSRVSQNPSFLTGTHYD
jgi:hypothetical protein